MNFNTANSGTNMEENISMSTMLTCNCDEVNIKD